MKPQPTVLSRLKQTVSKLLSKLQSLITPPPALRPIPIRRDSGKSVERWRNEGGH